MWCCLIPHLRWLGLRFLLLQHLYAPQSLSSDRILSTVPQAVSFRKKNRIFPEYLLQFYLHRSPSAHAAFLHLIHLLNTCSLPSLSHSLLQGCYSSLRKYLTDAVYSRKNYYQFVIYHFFQKLIDILFILV